MMPLGFRWAVLGFFPRAADGLRQGGGVDIKGAWVNIHKDRGGPQQLDNLGRGDEGKRGGKDGIARPDS